MGSSAKRKKEKKKDFQKQKLRVGKTNPKASNFTDTSFKAKSIVLTQQSISTDAPTAGKQFEHHLALLTHKSETQRRDSLAYLTNVLHSCGVTSQDPPVPYTTVILKAQPLILDASNSVRQQLVKLLAEITDKVAVSIHVEKLATYTRAGMTHLASDIRSTSLDVLQWLIDTAPEDLLGCKGGWFKTTKTFLGLLNWTQPEVGTNNGITSKWTSTKQSSSLSKSSTDNKLLVKQLTTFTSLLRAGLLPPIDPTTGQPIPPVYNPQRFSRFPLWHTDFHELPAKPHPFAHLNLFGPMPDEENQMYSDIEERQRCFQKHFHAAIEKGLENARKEGGEIGRGASGLAKVVKEGMEGHED